jgi:hypothetical protein
MEAVVFLTKDTDEVTQMAVPPEHRAKDFVGSW